MGLSFPNRAFFGRNVLRGLVDGIHDFIHLRQPRWRRFRSLGPVLLGSAMWIDDEDLIEEIGDLSAACIVVTKQGRNPSQRQKLEPLHALNGRTPGMPMRPFAELSGLAPRVGGKPAIVGPYTPTDDAVVPTIRTLGYRRLGGFPRSFTPSWRFSDISGGTTRDRWPTWRMSSDLRLAGSG